ncbi:hypothetical protein B0H65DRAFT_563774 [Neurospora tetraspora]|uniref:Uncharacterized protein n=1 Tax=Neurospora tetraspora TaxID=94610 RepID=A0AAE0JPQ7_9PEZI|nr:hypothetical protein B0H65DRAFT_563774 [Neurospora tetraspora]
MAHITFDSDWDPNTDLLKQARELVADRQSRGVSLWDLLCEQGAYVKDCTPGTMMYLFHSMVLVQVLRRLGGHGTGDEAERGEDDVLEQVRKLFTDRQHRGIDLWDLLCEQSAYVRVSPYGTMIYLFHSMVLVQILRRLGKTGNEDERSGNEQP